jgi:NAD(P)-dependent dehydrogenase (short-subunit alcohol dehydrogenase family)
MPISVNGKTAIVTGSTKGIGKGIANALSEGGANVVVVSRHQNECDETAKELISRYGYPAIGIKADVTKKEEIDSMVEKVVDKFGRIDILINNAGNAITKRAEDLTEEDFDRILNLDLRAVFFCSQAVGRHMIEQRSGKIISISSILGIIGGKQVLPYAVAKGGVLQMTKSLALEWAKYNIQVNAICPGYVITEINRDVLSDEKVAKDLLKKSPMRRFGQVEEIAGAALYLASDASSYMTGQQIVIDGGWCAE